MLKIVTGQSATLSRLQAQVASLQSQGPAVKPQGREDSVLGLGNVSQKSSQSPTARQSQFPPRASRSPDSQTQCCSSGRQFGCAGETCNCDRQAGRGGARRFGMAVRLGRSLSFPSCKTSQRHRVADGDSDQGIEKASFLGGIHFYMGKGCAQNNGGYAGEKSKQFQNPPEKQRVPAWHSNCWNKYPKQKLWKGSKSRISKQTRTVKIDGRWHNFVLT